MVRRVPVLLSADDDGSIGPKARVQPLDLAVLAGLTALLAFMWGRGRGVLFWLDEGISVGISSHAFGSIPGILRQDGSPPLYYLVLNVWMSIFGSSEPATHILSLGFALATIPAGLWAGWSLFGRRVGWILAALMALNPYLGYYANETRMYTMVVLLGLLATATFIHAFVFRRRRYLPAFTLFLTLLIYTHNWGLFFGVAAGVSALFCALVSRARFPVIRDAVLAFGGVALLYLPWVPTLLAQMAHTGSPFARRPTLVGVRSDLIRLFGSPEAFVAVGLGAALGVIALLQWPWKRAGLALVAMAILPGVAVPMAWMISRQESVWAPRYLAIVIGPMAVMLALGVARGGRVSLAGMALYGLLMAPVAVKESPTQKSDVTLVTQRFGPQLRPGDLVITDFGRVPLLSYYLPPGLRYAEAPGLVADERRTDQRDGVKRLRAADQTVVLPPLLATVPVGGRVLLVCPPLERLAVDETEFVQLFYTRCNEAEPVLRSTPGMRLIDERTADNKMETVHVALQARLFVRDP